MTETMTNPKDKSWISAGLHSAYLVGIPIFLMFYVQAGLSTQSWSIPEQRRIRAERRLEAQKPKKLYNALEQSIFGSEGLADIDSSGNISPRERLDAYEKMGLDSIAVSPGRRLTKEDWVRAIQGYEGQPDSTKGFNW